jgi:hypothetical protein
MEITFLKISPGMLLDSKPSNNLETSLSRTAQDDEDDEEVNEGSLTWIARRARAGIEKS